MKLNLKKFALRVLIGKLVGFMINKRRIKATLEKVKVVLNMPSPKIIKGV